MDAVLPILENSAASFVIDKLIDAATTYLRDQYYWKTDLQEELQNLRRLLPQIQAVVGFAEHRLTSYEASNPALMEWLRQFRDGIDEAEEVLDELKYRELEKKSDSDKSNLSSAVDAFVSVAKRLRPSDDILEGLRTCVKNLNTSASDIGNFLTLVTQTDGIGTGQMQQEILPLTHQSRITSALPALSFKGREEEKRKIIQYLLGDSEGESEIQRSQNVHCLPLVAMGGMGKTALAQQVFDHFENVKKEHLDIKIWVCVSTDFDASSLMKKILKYLTGESESVLLEQLPVNLKEELHSKRFLLVLDDAWNDDNWAEWEKLCTPLLYGQKGSWILLTTRSSSVVKMVSKVIRGTMEPMKLPGLSKDECRSLLSEYAFLGQNPNEFPLLKKIGEEIVEKLDGVPLLAKSIGGALNSKLEPDHWASILRSEIWKTRQDSRDEFIPALTLSYVMLPPRLKRCFSYCGIFPQDYQFNKQKLVGMWVAAGLIYSHGSEEGSEEDIANCCFDMLCNKSFFDVHTGIWIWSSSFYDIREDIYYTMHDMLNGLARHVSRYECCRIVHGAPSSILDYNGIRHISISITSNAQFHDIAKMVCKLKHLRTLWISCWHPQTHDDFIRDACKSPRRIRVLIIDDYQCSERVSDFVKLRFLDVSAQQPSRSPLNPIGKFYFLQVVTVRGYFSILTTGLSNLSNLRHLYGVREDALLSIAEVGKLTSLQKLCFSVGTEPGYRIDELMNMNNLHQLKIKRLYNVRSLEEANKANLAEKRNLTRLELLYRDGQFGEKEVSSYPDLDQQKVLAALRPPPTIRELFIKDYEGGRLAPWMDTPSLSWLESLELYACTSLEELPSLWKLPCLKFLKLNQLNAIRSLGCHSSDQMDIQFPVLEELIFNNFPVWEEWNGANDYKWFPHLKKFEIEDCPKLKKIPDLPLSIENLNMGKLGLEALPQFYKSDISLESLSPRLQGLTSLKALQTLDISDCKDLRELESLTALVSLRQLEIRGCPKLLATTFSTLQNPATTTEESATKIKKGTLPSLEKIYIDNIFYLPNLPMSERLKTLSIKNGIGSRLKPVAEFTCFPSEIEEWLLRCRESLIYLLLGGMPHLQFLPASLESFSSLETLILFSAPELKSLPRMPASLEDLTIADCSAELKKRCQENIGPDWPNINHIPNIYITGTARANEERLMPFVISEVKEGTPKLWKNNIFLNR